jgi:hypothetical protein
MRCTSRLLGQTRPNKERVVTPEPKPAAKKKAADIRVLRCLGPECGGMLAYEVDAENFLYVDLAWTAHQDGDTRYFPCPKCGGRNVVEAAVDAKGARRHQVTRFAPAPTPK